MNLTHPGNTEDFKASESSNMHPNYSNRAITLVTVCFLSDCYIRVVKRSIPMAVILFTQITIVNESHHKLLTVTGAI